MAELSERLDRMRDRVREGAHHTLRHASPDVVPEFEAEGLSWSQRAARLTTRMCEAEVPVIAPDERIVFTRTTRDVPLLYSGEEWARIAATHTLHELGPISNICCDWGMALSQGLLGRRRVAEETRERMAGDAEAAESLAASLETIDAVLGLAERYRREAIRLGRDEIAEALAQVPAHAPRTFFEALQSLRFLNAVVWLSGHYHVGLGRFDQYMWPYLEADLDAGRLDLAEAEELLAEFFIRLNVDSDLYPGVQQGDNGQTLMLGGVTRDGANGINPLTWMALRAARDVRMIDPKINLRIDADTDLELLCLATELTREGLGFPQYSNDDVVIPALLAHGYALEDARDYTVAACWEYIIPGKGMEVVNIGALSMPAAADAAIRQGLAQGESFDAIMVHVGDEITAQVQHLLDAYRKLILPPAPYYSVLMDGCLESGRDLSTGCKYNGFGIHGAHAANAADALSAVKALVFEEGSVQPRELLAALDADYIGYEALQARLCQDAPKVGNNDPRADELLTALYDLFADACEAVSDNGRGGRVRPGTGSAMYYVWLARGHEGMREPTVGATAEGRKRGEFFAANLAPAHNARPRGPLSVLQSFSKINYSRIYNGGPITMELSDTAFRDEESLEKVALFVRAYAQLGCQELQLNTLNLDTLMDAKAHPERHRDLIVRVWGWSGYFCELEPEYQDHVIARHQYAMA